MATEVWIDDAIGVVSSGGTTAPSPGSVESWTVTPTIGFAVASTSANPPTQFYVADTATGYTTEKCLVTVCPGGTSGGQTWSVTRGVDNTTPIAHVTGFTIQQVVTAGTLLNLIQASGDTMLGWFAPSVVTLTDASTVLVNAQLGNDFRLTLTASGHTIGNPSNSVDGMRITFQITQPASGGPYTVSWAGNYNFGASGAPTLSTAASKIDVIGFIYNAAKGNWLYAGSGLGN